MFTTRLRSVSAGVLLLVGVSATANGLSVKPPVRKSIKETNNSNLFNTQTRPSQQPDILSGAPGATGALHSSIAAQGYANTKKDLYGRYLDWIERKPIVAKSVTAAVVGCLGDIMAQCLEAHMGNYKFVMNWRRLSAFFASGLLFVGPYLHNFYEALGVLGNYMNTNVTKNKNAQTLIQLFVDQTLGVMMFLSTYFYVFELCESLVSFRVPSFSGATLKLTTNLGPILRTNYKIWPLLNFVSFTYVPKNMRVLFNNVLSVFWNIFLCAKLS